MISLHDQIQAQLCSFGTRLQELRLRRKWTLQELADQSGLSKAFLSRLESGDRQASIAAVLTLSRIFGVSLASLFEAALVADPCVIVRRGEGTEQTMEGLGYLPLSKANGCFNLQPIRVNVSRFRCGDERFRHEGEEWVYVLSGLLTLSLAGKCYDLAPGDAAHFDSRLPHRLIARGFSDAELLLVAALPSESAPASRPAIRPALRERRAIPSMEMLDFSASTGRAAKTGARMRIAPDNPSENPPSKSRKQTKAKQTT